MEHILILMTCLDKQITMRSHNIGLRIVSICVGSHYFHWEIWELSYISNCISQPYYLQLLWVYVEVMPHTVLSGVPPINTCKYLLQVIYLFFFPIVFCAHSPSCKRPSLGLLRRSLQNHLRTAPKIAEFRWVLPSIEWIGSIFEVLLYKLQESQGTYHTGMIPRFVCDTSFHFVLTVY